MDFGQQGEVDAGMRMDADEVVITGIEIGFWNLVTFLVKLAIAAIPAVFILALLWALVLGGLAQLGR